MTRPRISAPPTPLQGALDQIEGWLESPTLVLLAETQRHWSELRTCPEGGRIVGPAVYVRASQRFACSMESGGSGLLC